MEKPLIFITNDDGVSSKGIRSLYEVIRELGDVVIIAPDSPQSGTGHAITIHDPIRMVQTPLFPGEEAYMCSGTPVDCVKLGVYEVMHRKPDLLVSGINHGANTATNVLYSGTMSAAVEGAMEGIPSIGFSLNSYESDADFSVAQKVVKDVAKMVLANGLHAGVCLNVNIPDVNLEHFKGIKVCRQANAFWEDRFDKRFDQFNKPYYWLTGDFRDQEQAENTDMFWMEKGYASVVPTKYDLTAYEVMEDLKKWNL